LSQINLSERAVYLLWSLTAALDWYAATRTLRHTFAEYGETLAALLNVNIWIRF
jgi:hypothetical protein